MSIPQVPGQLKRGPVVALRAVFAGVGKVLMAAEKPKVTGPAAAQAHVSADQSRHDSRKPHGQAGGASESASRWRSLDQTGNVRLLSAEDLDGEDREAAPVPQVPEAPEAPEQPGPEQQAPASQAPSAELPLPSYDTLTLASIRARLGGLDVAQLRVLVAYENANAERPEVLRMLERRIEKLEAGS